MNYCMEGLQFVIVTGADKIPKQAYEQKVKVGPSKNPVHKTTHRLLEMASLQLRKLHPFNDIEREARVGCKP